MRLAPLLILPFLFSFKPLPNDYQGLTDQEFKRILDSVNTKSSAPVRNVTPKKRSKKGNLGKKVEKLEAEIKRLKGVGSFNPTFSNSYPPIPTLSRFRGVLEGNIVSAGQPVTFKVKLLENSKIPPESYLACIGTNQAAQYNYRIISKCDTLVTPETEYKVDVSLKDDKSVVGLKPDFIHTGEEQAILGEGFSAIATGIIDAKMDRTLTATGFATDPTFKNSLLNGLVQASRLANEKSKDHTNNSVVVLAVKDKTPVIVEWNRRFTYENN